MVILLLCLPPPAFCLPPSYDSFPLVHTRNVFDPDRRVPRPAGSGTPAPDAAAARPDYAALTGTLVNADKSFAFFSGSRPEFNKVLTVRDRLADAAITDITPLNIEVERAGQRVRVAVGQTVPLDAQATPGPAPAPAVSDAPAVVGASPQPATRSPQPASASAPSAAKLEEIRQRMMQKRQQDLK